MQTRPDFEPSPRTPDIPAALSRAERYFKAASAGFQRAARCPALYTRARTPVWRWVCLPSGYPLDLGRGM